MEIRQLGRTGLRVSRVALGTMSFGRWVDEEESKRILHKALDRGINFIDTANIYGRGQDTGDHNQRGEAETILGRLIKGMRDDLVIMSKIGLPMGPGVNDRGLSRTHILREINNILRRLGTDYLDILLIHRPDGVTPLEETLSAFNDLVTQGKTRYVGCSNMSAWEICKGLWISDRRNWAPFTVVQPEYSVLRRQIEAELLPFCQSEGLGVAVYSPLARGLLGGRYTADALKGQFPPGSRAAQGEKNLLSIVTGRNLRMVLELDALARRRNQTLPQFAFAWVLAQPAVTSAIIGSSNVDRLAEVLTALDTPLDEETLREVDELQRRIDSAGTV